MANTGEHVLVTTSNFRSALVLRGLVVEILHRLSCICRAICSTCSGVISCLARAIGLGYDTSAGDLEGQYEGVARERDGQVNT
jgi:hypothetical protein